MNFRTLFALLLVVTLFASLAGAQSSKWGRIPERIVLNLTAQPATSIAVTWRTRDSVVHPVAQVARAGDWTDFPTGATAVEARTEKVCLDTPSVAYHYSAILAGLQPNTLYAYRVGYRVGVDSAWSEWNQFTTAKAEPAPFEFVFFGDPQTGVMDVCPRIFREALRKAPNAAFWLFIGDLMELPQYDRLWNEWFRAMGFIQSLMPSVTVPGSHEYALKTGNTVRWDVLTPLWRAHFTFPENGPKGMEERVYYFDYQGVRFVMLDAQMGLKDQSPWLEKVLADNPNRWTVAAFHEPVFSVALDRDGHETRNAFMPLFDKYGVDLVLTGHDHVYSRSHKLRNGKVVGDQERGTVYVTSVCGSKAYSVNSHYKDLMQCLGNQVQLYQVISIDRDRLTYKSCTATGKTYDAFELTK